MKREDIYKAIDAERVRQEELHPGFTAADSDVSPWYKMLILIEEVGESARAILDAKDADLKKEMTEVSAVAVAWLESMEWEREQ